MDRSITWRAAGQLQAFRAGIREGLAVSSFTSLAAHDLPGSELPSPELPDWDRATLSEPASAQPTVRQGPQSASIFTFPRGAGAGIFLHEIFEKLDFNGCPADKTAGLVRGCFDQHGFGEEWASSGTFSANGVACIKPPICSRSASR